MLFWYILCECYLIIFGWSVIWLYLSQVLFDYIRLKPLNLLKPAAKASVLIRGRYWFGYLIIYSVLVLFFDWSVIWLCFDLSVIWLCTIKPLNSLKPAAKASALLRGRYWFGYLHIKWFVLFDYISCLSYRIIFGENNWITQITTGAILIRVFL